MKEVTKFITYEKIRKYYVEKESDRYGMLGQIDDILVEEKKHEEYLYRVFDCAIMPGYVIYNDKKYEYNITRYIIGELEDTKEHVYRREVTTFVNTKESLKEEMELFNKEELSKGVLYRIKKIFKI